MSPIDWFILIVSLVSITAYGMWKGRGNRNIEGYLLADKSMPWHTVGFSIIATQASAITFLSAPGQGYADGMGFVQIYLGLPIAMIILSVTFIPIYRRLNVYTAYEYLETRFDLKTRSFAAFLFLIQRSLSTGLTIYAPSIILSCLFNWNVYLTNLIIGSMVILYTFSGGSRAVSYTHMGQTIVILSGMLIAAVMLVYLLPPQISFVDALHLAGRSGKLNAIDFSFNPESKYNIWSGLIAGLFLSLSYFGTDQTQVSRYLGGKSVTESRLGVLFNGIVKIPMQFGLLIIGVMLFVFYQFENPPMFFNPVEVNKVHNSRHSEEYKKLEVEYNNVMALKKSEAIQLSSAIKSNDAAKAGICKKNMMSYQQEGKNIKEKGTQVMLKNDASSSIDDVNYVFLYFVIHYLPQGIIGLIIAVVFASSMSATSSAFNALASTTVVDIYKRSIKKNGDESHYLKASRWATVFWGICAIVVANLATRMGSLIEAVNKLGSLFYGTILGIFIVAFYFKKIKGTPVFIAGIISELIILVCYETTTIAFLWFNLIGCVLVVVISWVVNGIMKKNI